MSKRRLVIMALCSLVLTSLSYFISHPARICTLDNRKDISYTAYERGWPIKYSLGDQVQCLNEGVGALVPQDNMGTFVFAFGLDIVINFSLLFTGYSLWRCRHE